MSNEAAETLQINFRSQTVPLGRYNGDAGYKVFRKDLDAALAAERRATVERIPAAIEEAWDWRGTTPADLAERVLAILDAEAAS